MSTSILIPWPFLRIFSPTSDNMPFLINFWPLFCYNTLNIISSGLRSWLSSNSSDILKVIYISMDTTGEVTDEIAKTFIEISMNTYWLYGHCVNLIVTFLMVFLLTKIVYTSHHGYHRLYNATTSLSSPSNTRLWYQ